MKLISASRSLLLMTVVLGLGFSSMGPLWAGKSLGNRQAPLDESSPLVQEFRTNLRKARDGDVEALHEVGLAYLLGNGVPKSIRDAFLCFERASAQGNLAAKTELGLLYLGYEGIERNEDLALEYLTFAATGGYREAQLKLFRFFREKNEPLPLLKWGLMAQIKRNRHLIPNHFPRSDAPQSLEPPVDWDGLLSDLGKQSQRHKTPSFAVPSWNRRYGGLGDAEKEIGHLLGTLRSLKPGFLMDGLALSEGLRADIEKNPLDFFSLNRLWDKEYLTLGLENYKQMPDILEIIEEKKHEKLLRSARRILSEHKEEIKKELEEELQNNIHAEEKSANPPASMGPTKLSVLREHMAKIESSQDVLNRVADVFRRYLSPEGAPARNGEFFQAYPFWDR